jgi:predicted permease
MPTLRSVLAGIRRLLSGRAFEADLDDEVRHYVDMAAREHMRAGVPPDEAYRRARAEMGGPESVKEEVRGGGWEAALESLVRDLGYGARTLVRNPAYTLVAVVTLAIGVGANTTVFSIVNALLLRPPPHVIEPERLVMLYTSDYSGVAYDASSKYGASSYPDYADLREQRDVFTDLTLMAPRPVGIGEGDGLERVLAELVADNYFRTLGVTPHAGRFFTPEEGRLGVPAPVAVLGHDLWVRRFGADPSIVGRTARVDGRELTVVGVAPRGFAGTIRGLVADVWIPVTATPLLGSGEGRLDSRGDRGYLLVGRLAPGVSAADAQARMDVAARQLFAAYPDYWRDITGKGRRISVLSERETRVAPQIRGPALGFVALLVATAVLVLLICCANVATLALSRASRRGREIGVRLSLGASRGRIIRQLLAESALVGLTGGAAGAALALMTTRAIATFQPPLPVRVALDLSLDARVLAFTFAAAVAAGVIFGLAPAMRASRATVVGTLKGGDGAIAVAGRRFSPQNVLVVSQMAMSLLLVVAAGLFVRSLSAAARIDPGFASDHLLVVELMPRPGTERGADRAAVPERVRERLAATAGVASVSWADAIMLGFDVSRRGTTVEGYRPREGEDMEFARNMVGPGYFETMRMPLAEGRGFTPADRAGAPPVIVVNEAFARRFWPGERALGNRVSVNGPEGPFREVVGVARDAKYATLTESARPYLFLPALQEPGAVQLHVRTTAGPRPFLPVVRQAVAEAAPDWTLMSVLTMDEQVGTSLLPQRVAGTVLSLFGAVALILASIGLYGIIAYSVAGRVREFGVRMALGAERGSARRMVLRQGLTLAAIGLGVGLPLAWSGSRLLSSFLIGTGAADPVSFGAAAALLVVVSLLASWAPARRATGVDPLVALRSD